MPFVDEPILGERFADALATASRWHARQTRKKVGRAIPYVTHLLAVASLVLEDGGTEDEAIAGLLHDSIEDLDVTAAAIEGRYGAEVARIVLACSDAVGNPKPPWRDRKEHHIASLRAADEAVLRVTAADKLHNCRDIVADVREEGRERLRQFRRGIRGPCWDSAGTAGGGARR